MSHEIETMAFSGAIPWHKLGKQLARDLTGVEMLSAAGLDWNVRLAKMYVNSMGVTPDGKPMEVPDVRAVRRSSDHAVLGTVGMRYAPIQNSEVADLAQAISGQGEAYCHTAGSLMGGKLIWFLLKFPGHLTVPGDNAAGVEKYMVLVSSHDGSQALQVFYTPIRVVCANTLNWALQGAASKLTIRHTASSKARLKAAQLALKGAHKYYEKFDELCAKLVGTPFTDTQMEELAEYLVPAPTKKKAPKTIEVASWVPQAGASLVAQISDGYAPLPGEAAARTKTTDADAVPTVTQNKREEIVSLFSSGKGITSNVRGTAWAAVNAVAEYTDHHRTTRASSGSADEARGRSALLGSGAAMKSKSLARVLEMVATN